MSNALILNEKPGSEPLPSSAGASSLINGHYAPVAKDSDGYTWVRSNVTIQGNAAELYAIWRDIERIPQWQDEIVSVTQTSPKTSHWIMQHGELSGTLKRWQTNPAHASHGVPPVATSISPVR